MQASQTGPWDEGTLLRFSQQAIYCIQMPLLADVFLRTQGLFKIQNLISLSDEIRKQNTEG